MRLIGPEGFQTTSRDFFLESSVWLSNRARPNAWHGPNPYIIPSLPKITGQLRLKYANVASVTSSDSCLPMSGGSADRLLVCSNRVTCNILYLHLKLYKAFPGILLVQKANPHLWTLASLLRKRFKFLPAIPINIHHSVCNDDPYCRLMAWTAKQFINKAKKGLNLDCYRILRQFSAEKAGKSFKMQVDAPVKSSVKKSWILRWILATLSQTCRKSWKIIWLAY